MGMLDEVGSRLVEAPALGVLATPTVSGDIYGGAFPARPDDIISLYEQTAFEPERTFGGVVQVVLNLQTLVRATTYAAADTRIKLVFERLDGFKGLLLGTYYYSILARSYPFPLGVDENNRHRWSCNYVVRKNKS